MHFRGIVKINTWNAYNREPSQEPQAVFLRHQYPRLFQVLGPFPGHMKPHLPLLDPLFLDEMLQGGLVLPVLPDSTIPDQHVGGQVGELSSS